MVVQIKMYVPEIQADADLEEYINEVRLSLIRQGEKPRKYLVGLAQMACEKYSGTPSRDMREFWHSSGLFAVQKWTSPQGAACSRQELVVDRGKLCTILRRITEPTPSRRR